MKDKKSITGGTKIGWKNQLQRNGRIVCVTENCEFHTTDLLEIQAHHTECVINTGKTWVCLLCAVSPNTLETITKHINDEHVEDIARRQAEFTATFENSESDADFGSESSDSEGSSGDEEHDDDHNEDEEGYVRPARVRDRRHRRDPEEEAGPDRFSKLTLIFSNQNCI